MIKKGEITMGTPITDKNNQVNFLKQRLNMFLGVLESINPEEMKLDDIDRLLAIIDELETKCNEFHNRES